MKKVVFLIILALMAYNAYGYSIRFELRDYSTSEPILEGSVDIVAYQDDKKETFSFLLNNSSQVELNLSKAGAWNFEIMIDQVGTPGNDYFVRHYSEIEERITSQRIFLFRVGSVRGRVEDINKNLVSDALVRIECEENRFIKISLNTDFFGTFEAENIPAGSCVAYASFQDAIGIEEFSLTKGEIKSIVVKLDRKVMSTKIMIRRFAIWGLISLGGLSVLLFVMIRAKKSHAGKKASKESYEKGQKKTENNNLDRGHTLIEIDHSFDDETHPDNNKNEEKKIVPSKLKQVMETLKENEKQVVQYFISNNMEAKLSKVRFTLKIPKTTFFRIIKSLKDKKILIEDSENPRKARISRDLL